MDAAAQIIVVMTAIKPGYKNICAGRDTDEYIDEQIDQRAIGADGKGGRVIYVKPNEEKEKHEVDFLIT